MNMEDQSSPLSSSSVTKMCTTIATSSASSADNDPLMTVGRRVSTLETAVPGHKLGFDMPSVVSMEILESQEQLAGGSSESRNDAVIQRVSELKRLVEDAEKYLNGNGVPEATSNQMSDVETSSIHSDLSQFSKSESDASSAYGRLRHSDSLLLLTQGQKQLSLPDKSSILFDSSEQASSSDTDSVNTPSATPIHSPAQRLKSNEKTNSRYIFAYN